MNAIKNNLYIILTLVLGFNQVPLSAQNTWADYFALIATYGQKIYEKREIALWSAIGILGYRELRERKLKEQKNLKKKEEVQNNVSTMKATNERFNNIELRVVDLETKQQSISKEMLEVKATVDSQGIAVTACQLKHQELEQQVNTNTEKIGQHSKGILLLARNQIKGLSEIANLLKNNESHKKTVVTKHPLLQKAILENADLPNDLSSKTTNHTL